MVRSFEDAAAGFRDMLHPELVWFPVEENLTPAHGIDFRFYAHFTVKGDKVIRIYDHEQRASALEAAGLSRENARRAAR